MSLYLSFTSHYPYSFCPRIWARASLCAQFLCYLTPPPPLLIFPPVRLRLRHRLLPPFFSAVRLYWPSSRLLCGNHTASLQHRLFRSFTFSAFQLFRLTPPPAFPLFRFFRLFAFSPHSSAFSASHRPAPPPHTVSAECLAQAPRSYWPSRADLDASTAVAELWKRCPLPSALAESPSQSAQT